MNGFSIASIFVTFLMAIACVHDIQFCDTDPSVNTLVAKALVDRFKCTETQEVSSDVKELGHMGCDAREVFQASLDSGEYSGLMVDCLILEKSVARALEEGTPSSWKCAGGTLDESLVEVCKGL